MTSTDIWSDWLLKRRCGGDSTEMQRMLDYLGRIRDTVIEHAALRDGEALLDVGCGDGLIAFGALQNTTTGRVVFSDISQPLLDQSRTLAREMAVLDRCTFVRASAEDLSPFSNASFEAVTTRSVLIYVADKRRAFREFYRVLKPEGRLSIFEPINRFRWPEPTHLFWGFNVTPVADIGGKVKAIYAAIQPIERDPVLNFDERDLLDFAEASGFNDVHLTFQVEVGPQHLVASRSDPPSWEAMLKIAGNPRIPTLSEALDRALTPAERQAFTDHLRPLVETKQGLHKSALAYLWATKH